MAQVLIVEGKDGVFLTELCRARGLSSPTGYEKEEEFKHKTNGFIKQGGGVIGAIKNFKEYLDKPDYDNIGLVLDANEVGPAVRCQSIEAILNEKFPGWGAQCVPNPDGIVIHSDGLPVIGIWIMPDNHSPGYLEHFIADLIPNGDALWPRARNVTDDLPERRFTRAKIQKAYLHTWNAWQAEPGIPFGRALFANILNQRSLLADRYILWYERTFNLQTT